MEGGGGGGVNPGHPGIHRGHVVLLDQEEGHQLAMGWYQYGKKLGIHVGSTHVGVMASEAVVKMKYAALGPAGSPKGAAHVAVRGTADRMSCPVGATATIKPVFAFLRTTGCMGATAVPGAAPASTYTVHCGGCDAVDTVTQSTSMPTFPSMRGSPQLPL